MSLRATGIPICTDTTFLVGNLQLHCQFIRSDNFRAVTRTDGMLIPVSSPVMGSLKEPLNLAENTEFFRRFCAGGDFENGCFFSPTKTTSLEQAEQPALQKSGNSHHFGPVRPKRIV